MLTDFSYFFSFLLLEVWDVLGHNILNCLQSTAHNPFTQKLRFIFRSSRFESRSRDGLSWLRVFVVLHSFQNLPGIAHWSRPRQGRVTVTVQLKKAPFPLTFTSHTVLINSINIINQMIVVTKLLRVSLKTENEWASYHWGSILKSRS